MTRNGNDKSLSGANAGGAKKKRVGPFQYLDQVVKEARKVTWTTWNETWVSTLMVLVLTLIAMFFFWGVDSLITIVINFLLSLG
ncbi:MAG: preprotein translocase subunit SecE [Alphaproteobacteria bacterium]|nr:preprotein translocase subunit SecE [Alphaproteobacteria bacterium]